MRYPGLFCCEPTCQREAEYEITGDLGPSYDNYTQVCHAHIETGITTPDAFGGKRNQEWIVRAITAAEKAAWRQIDSAGRIKHGNTDQ